MTKTHGTFWARGDWNAFWGLFSNVLANLIVLTSLLTFVLDMPGDVVFATILPALGVSLMLGNFYYVYMGKRLAEREERDDVTALPYGPSVPHMFLVVFVVMLPVYTATGDPLLAWQVGLAWAFIEGVIELSMAGVGPTIRKYTPRAAMLGTLAGVSVAYLAMSQAMQMVATPYIGLVTFGIILVAWIGLSDLPFGIPGGVAVIVVGTAIGWATGYMEVEPLQQAVGGVAVQYPTPQLSELIAGFDDWRALLATAIPLGIYNGLECMNNVESASAAGDEYSAREAMALDGVGTIFGAALGNPFPSATYIGHPGWKDIGGRLGYSIATGFAVGIICLGGAVAVVVEIIPLVAVIPILVYIGLKIGSQAFTSTPSKHAPAVVLALIPNMAEWANDQVDNALVAAGTSAEEVGYSALASESVYYEGMQVISAGAVMIGLLWGAIAVFVIENEWWKAIVVVVLSALLSFLGVIHAPRVAINGAPGMTVGYLALAAVFLVMELTEALTDRAVDVTERSVAGGADDD